MRNTVLPSIAPANSQPGIARLRPIVAALLLATAASPSFNAYAASTVAASAVQPYALPAASLSSTLNQISHAAKITLSVEASLVAGKTSSPVSGNYTPRQALEQALLGTGLSLVENEPGSYGLKRVEQAGNTPAANHAPQQGSLPEVAVVAKSERRSATTDGTASYASPVVTIGKGEQALKDIPQSVSVLTRQRMNDQGLVDLTDAVDNITGLVATRGVGAGTVISSRGFQINTMQYDGVPLVRNMYSLGNWSQDTLAMYDRVEVLRGAAGLLQGTGSPGGAINFVRKRGQAEHTLSLQAKAGSWDQYGVQLDVGGPLNADGSVRGRLVLDEDRAGSYINYVWHRNQTAYAALDFDLGANTVLGVGISHLDNQSRPSFVGFPRYANGNDIGLSRSTFTGATWNRASNTQTTLYADLTHQFNAQWRYKLSATSMTEDNENVHQRAAGAVANDGSGVRYGDFAVDFHGRSRGLDMFVQGDFAAAGLQHELVLGANYANYQTEDAYARRWTSGANIFNLNNHRAWENFDSIAAGGVRVESEYNTRQTGVYTTLRTKWSDNLTSTIGGRNSWYKQSYAQPGSTPSVEQGNGRFTPYLGLVYALNDAWSVYGSYTDVFETQSARTVSGSVLEPVIGSNYEAGIKGEFADGRLTSSLAVFRYDHENRAVLDYAAGMVCGTGYCSKAAGEVRSQGVEAEINGELLPRLQVFTGYTYNTTKFLSDPVNQGSIFSTWTPKHLLKVWASYQLPGQFDKLTLAGGVNMQSHVVSYDNVFEIPGFAVWNARVAYQLNPELLLSLNANNLFDKRYFVPSYNSTGSNNYYGEPSSVMLTLRYSPRLK